MRHLQLPDSHKKRWLLGLSEEGRIAAARKKLTAYDYMSEVVSGGTVHCADVRYRREVSDRVTVAPLDRRTVLDTVSCRQAAEFDDQSPVSHELLWTRPCERRASL